VVDSLDEAFNCFRLKVTVDPLGNRILSVVIPFETPAKCSACGMPLEPTGNDRVKESETNGVADGKGLVRVAEYMPLPALVAFCNAREVSG
jgi:hypothetical protein